MSNVECIENTGNWFVASVVLLSNRTPSLGDVWENTYLVKAENFSAAFDKAQKIALEDVQGRKQTESEVDPVSWRVVGVSELLPIFEDIADGCELMWADHGMLPNSDAQRLVKTEEELRSINPYVD